ncbi:MAG: OmpA family protein [Sphingobacteriia bacterium]
MMNCPLPALLLWLLLPPTLLAQAPGTAEQQAWNYFQQGDYTRALPLYRQAVAEEPNRFPAQLSLGLCLKQLGLHDESLEPLQQAYRLDSLWNPVLHLYLGDAYLFNLDYAQAYYHYGRFLNARTSDHEQKELVRQNRRKAEWALAHLADSVAFAPVNLGAALNGPGEDYNACLTADDRQLYFNSHREGCLGGYLEGVYQDYGSDFYASRWQGGAWLPATNLGRPVNSLSHEKEFCLSPDGQQLVFGRHPLRRGDGRYNCDLYQSLRTRAGWQMPQALPGPLNGDYCDSWPSLSADGQTLYFISDRPGGYGGFDIWYSHRQDTSWTEPQNAGTSLNTPGDEFDVFMHPDDSTLYFSSNWHDGFGGFDLFLSRRAPGGLWQRPQNLGYPLNTPWDEFDLFVNAAGTTAYLNSDRLGGYGRQDLYRTPLDARIRPRSTFYLKGRIATGADSEARVSIIDLARGDTVRSLRTLMGNFLTAIPTGKKYAVLTEAEGYLPHSLHYEPDTAYGRSDTLTIQLQPVATGASFTLHNLFFDFDKASLRPESQTELHLLLRLLAAYPHIRLLIEGHTDAVGNPAYNQQLSEQRAEAVRQWLLTQGVRPDRLQTRGRGAQLPIAGNDTESERQQNRRVVFYVQSW